MKFSIIVTGWNCEKYVNRCLASIKEQDYDDYEVLIVDDGSEDITSFEIREFISENDLMDKFHSWSFESNKGTYYARDYAISKAKGKVIVMVDMDDCLLPNALNLINDAYIKNPLCLMTYGNYQFTDGSTCPIQLEYSDEIHKDRIYRDDDFRCTHLRTFEKELYHRIPKWELTKSEKNSYPDAEILFSMMEMCGKERMEVINEPIYLYNTDNENSSLKRFGKDYEGYEEICKRPKRNLI